MPVAVAAKVVVLRSSTGACADCLHAENLTASAAPSSKGTQVFIAIYRFSVQRGEHRQNAKDSVSPNGIGPTLDHMSDLAQPSSLEGGLKED